MIGPRAAPSSPRSPFLNIHRRVIKAVRTNSEALRLLVALRYWRFQRRSSRLSKSKRRAKTCSFEARDERESRCASVHAHTFSCWGGHGFLSKGEEKEVGEHSAQRANMPAPAPRTC